MNNEAIDEKNLDQAASKRDLQGLEGRLSEKFATKADLKQGLQGLRQDLPGIVTHAMQEVITDEFTKVKGELKEWKEEIATGNDRVAKDYDTFQTEKAALSERVGRLETALFPDRN